MNDIVVYLDELEEVVGNRKQNFYSILPAQVRYDKELTPNAKILFSEIAALSQSKGYCFAGNSYFSKIYECSCQSVINWINALIERGYIKRYFVKDRAKNIIVERRIYVTIDMYANTADVPNPDECLDDFNDGLELDPTQNNLSADSKYFDHPTQNNLSADSKYFDHPTQNNLSDNKQDNKKSNKKENIEVNTICAELQKAPSHEEPVNEGVIFKLALNDNTLYGITEAQIDEWQVLYPAVDVEQEIRNMIGWINANPTRRKTRRGILRFCNGWLSRAQDKGRSFRQRQYGQPISEVERIMNL